MPAYEAPFARPLRTLVASLSLTSLAEMGFIEAMEMLHDRSEKTNVSIRLAAYASRRVEETRLLLRSTPASEVEVFTEALEDYIFHQLLAAVSYRYGLNVPRYHHWLPVSYANRFATWRGKTTRAFRVNSGRFELDTGELITRGACSSDFAHGRRKSSGFYHLSAEYFFSLIEHEASIAYRHASVGDSGSAFAPAMSYVFFLVQAVRNPHPNTQHFPSGSLRGILEALEHEMRNITYPLHLQIVESVAPLAFTPYAPPRVRRLRDHARVQYFPMGSHLALLASDRPLTPAEASLSVARAQESLVAFAQQTGVQVFGLSHEDLVDT